jgi:hypothetical protein
VNLMDLGWEGMDLDSSGSGYWPVASSCEHGNELKRSIKGGICRVAERIEPISSSLI